MINQNIKIILESVNNSFELYLPKNILNSSLYADPNFTQHECDLISAYLEDCVVSNNYSDTLENLILRITLAADSQRKYSETIGIKFKDYTFGLYSKYGRYRFASNGAEFTPGKDLPDVNILKDAFLKYIQS